MSYVEGYVLVPPQSACSLCESGAISGWLNVEVPEETGFAPYTGYITDGIMNVQEQMCRADVLVMAEAFAVADAMVKINSGGLYNEILSFVETLLINENFHKIDDSISYVEIALIAYDILAALADQISYAESLEITNS